MRAHSPDTVTIVKGGCPHTGRLRILEDGYAIYGYADFTSPQLRRLAGMLMAYANRLDRIKRPKR